MPKFTVIIKENGNEQAYSREKAEQAIISTMQETGNVNKDIVPKLVDEIEEKLESLIGDKIPTTNDWANSAIGVIKKYDKELARHYADKKLEKSINRVKSSDLMNSFRDILESAGDDPDSINTENANLNGFDPAAQLHRIGSESNKNYILNYMLPREYSRAHKEKWLHIHDLDYFELSYNCLQIDLKNVLEGGFDTGGGLNKEPKSIQSAAALACIALQGATNQQFGGIALGNLDFGFSKYVNLTFRKEFRKAVENYYELLEKPVPEFLSNFALERLYYGINHEDIEELNKERSFGTMSNAKNSVKEQIQSFNNGETPDTVTYTIGENTYQDIPLETAVEHIAMSLRQ
jgi:ribonucleoside-triphosphate reductase